MNRIDKIIKESINRFVLREVDEASLKNPAEAWANMEGGTYKEKRGKYNVQPRQRVKTLDDATTINQAGRLIRASWYSVELGAIGGFARNYAVYGINNADKFFNFFRDQEGNSMFVKFNELYQKVDDFTSDIEKWAKYGEEVPVLSRMKQLTVFLDELATYIGFLVNKASDMMGYKEFLKLRGKPGKKGNIIDGYDNVNGLLDTVLNPKKQKETNKVTAKIRHSIDSINDFVRRMEEKQIRY